jgi:hypothetical protein
MTYSIKGKSGEEYIFEEYDITGDSADAPIGIYVLAKRIKDVSISNKSFYNNKKIIGIQESGIAFSNPLGHATRYLYHSCENTKEVKEILVDLDEDDNFKIIINDVI